MNKLLVFTLILGTCAIAGFGNELERLTTMGETLQKNTIEGFMEAVRANKWAMPRIPSKWHVDTYAVNDEDKRLMQAARDFGYRLVLRLEDLAKEQQALPPSDILFQRTMLLYDLGEWCTGIVGYGNIFLERRCLDIAAVGLARLTASIKFPIDKCKQLAMRTTPKWQEMPYRVQVLNDEANANLFINANASVEELDRHWIRAKRIQEQLENPARVEEMGKRLGIRPPPPPNATIVNATVFTNNLNFFADVECSSPPMRLSCSWDCRQHWWILSLGGYEAQWRNQARVLLNYRSIVGFFPPPFARSEEELKRVEAEIVEAAKWGRKISKMEDDRSYDPLEMAFRKELEKTTGISTSCAVEALVFKQVQGGTFFDPDTAEIQFEKEQEIKARRLKQTK